MEFIIGVIAVLGLLYLLGVELSTLILIVQIILSVSTLLMLLFFLFCDGILLFSEKRHARLIGIEKMPGKEEEKDKMMSRFAFYMIGEEKMRNWFPAETLMSRKIYEKQDCFVRIARLGKKQLVFDRHSVVIVVSGTVLMGITTVLMLVYLLSLFGAL